MSEDMERNLRNRRGQRRGKIFLKNAVLGTGQEGSHSGAQGKG